MFIQRLLSHKNILKLSGHACTDFTVEMRPSEMLFGLFVVPEIHVFKLFRTLVTNKTLFMYHLQMSPKLVNVVEQLTAEIACGMEQY